MNYGVNTNEDSEKQSTDSQAVDNAENEKQWKEYFEYCKKYYEQQQQQDGDGKDEVGKEAPSAESDPSSYYYYYYYYQQYYQQQQEQGKEWTDSSKETDAYTDQGPSESSNPQVQQSGTSKDSQTSNKKDNPVTNPGKRKTEEAGLYFLFIILCAGMPSIA